MEPANAPSLDFVRRHLHWLCTAPALLDDALCFDIAAQLPPDWPQRVDALLAAPSAQEELVKAASTRLGHYFEALYAQLLSGVLGWQVLARNLPVRSPERTLGELDFLVLNPTSQAVEHHEIAVKFYLGYQADEATPRWYGPNSQDRFDLKRQRLLEHQARLTQRAESVAVLRAAGLPLPTRSRIVMLGYLFDPPSGALPLPQGASEQCLRSRWQRGATLTEDMLVDAVVLHKPHWLGSWSQAGAPALAASLAACERIAAGGPPRLFARLARDEASGEWRERERFFVVPEHWP
jgi:hypothetical protein